MKSGVILSGFSMIEMLIALLVMSLFIPLANQSLQLIQVEQKTDVYLMEDMIGIEQLRIYLACGTILDVEADVLHVYMDKDMQLSLVNSNLTLQPGTLVFLSDISHVEFYDDGYHVMMKYCKDKRNYEVWIGYK